ncbi:hypothetical protein BP6252_06646 [Coleophoma cylindrospora]|uniref:VOC domain-containing protein n=1 Tax=Coleophoma cylindrospora TaxID=1849047 RepID=A0A3D8RNN2_9HELO|nr:hypothetical protein BP6252_06646 [Coleophoma cylindrospora]
MDGLQPNLKPGAVEELSPNRGASVPDTVAVSSEREGIKDWRERNNIDITKQIKLVKLIHMRYQHPDLGEITEFLRDFGMNVAKKTDDQIWYGGYGPDQYVYYARKGPKQFLGGCYEVESYADLEKAAKLPGASEIEAMKDDPGNGFMITIFDPEGFPVNLMHGQTAAEPKSYPKPILINHEAEKPRVRRFNRFEPGPAAVHKLGHYGLCVQNFDSQVEFYTRNFNLVPTDFLYVDEPAVVAHSPTNKRDVAVFAHIDRGENLVDHHTFFMSTNKTSHVHHCSFEVHDFDTQNLGHQWLAKKGYKSVWGVGRHILGSQIFDYWWDTTGNMIEHYADGDLVNEHTPIGYGPVGDESLAVWGPEVPSTFLD